MSDVIVNRSDPEQKRRSKQKPKDLGNFQCEICLNIFPVNGELPQDVTCPRCGAEMHLEWKGQS